MKVKFQSKKGKARTICEITESIASITLQFFGSRNWQRYNDGKTQPEGTQDKLPQTTHWDRKGSQDIQGDIYILQSSQYPRSQTANDRVTQHKSHVHGTTKPNL